MSTVRRGPLPTDNYTIVSNGWTRDAALSWEARGLLAWLAGHSESHEITEADMIAAGSFKRDGVRRMIRELEARGYLIRERTYDVRGGSSVDYVLVDPRPTAPPADGSDGGRAEQGELFSAKKESAAQTADLPADGSGGGRSYTEDQKKTKTPSVSSASLPKKATRVPDDFEPTEQMIAWFMDKKFNRWVSGSDEHEKFMDHYRAAPGEKGLKRDWVAAWRNWMRIAVERAMQYGAPRRSMAQPGTALAPSSGGPYRPSTTDQKVAQTLELGRRLQAMEDAK